jgi:hypothetical protein
MYYTPHFSTKSTLNSITLRQDIFLIPVLIWISISQRLPFCSVTSPLPNLSPRMACLVAPKTWECEEARYGLRCGLALNILSEFRDCFMCFQICVCVCGSAFRYWRRISAPTLWGVALLKYTSKVLSVWMYGSELMVWPRDVMSTKITSST